VTPYREALANLDIPINYNPVCYPLSSTFHLHKLTGWIQQDSGDPYGLYNSATAVNRTTGTRSYAANTYFAYNSARPNFVVLTEAQATKIEFSKPKSDKDRKIKATGVSFVHNSTLYTVKAKKEVILSAGNCV
jgi:hypothetical protein